MKRSVRMAQADLDAIFGKIKSKPAVVVPIFSKYGNKKVEWRGMKFDSQRELARYQDLLLLEKAGQIQDLKRQVAFELLPAVVLGGKKKRPIRYIADFSYVEKGQPITEDSKGCRTALFLLKRRLMKHFHDIEIRET